MSATSRKCWGRSPTGDKYDRGNPHALQHGLQSMIDGDGEPPQRLDSHRLVRGGREVG